MDFSQMDPATVQKMIALFSKMNKVRTAHAVLMPVAIALWFPLGVFLLRLLKVNNTVRWHAIWQCIGLALLITGFGLGCWLSNTAGDNNEGHVILGIVVTVLFLLMPFVGWFHHRHFATRGSRDFKRYIHVWGGRVLILLGIINGGTGLSLSGAATTSKVVYAIFSGLIGIAYGWLWFWKSRQSRFGVQRGHSRTDTELEMGGK